MTTTEHYNLALPDPNNDVDEEFFTLQLTLQQIDAIIHALRLVVDQKAAVGHGHPQSDIIGLVDALASKMNGNTTFSLDDLTDVDGAVAAAVNYLLVKGADGQWRPSSAAAAIGNHQHSQSDIVGLAEALTALSNAIGQKATASTVYTKQQVDDAIAAASALPLGTIIDVYGNATTIPAGFLKVVPGLEITAAYPQLRTWALANGWAVNGSGNPVFPSTDDALFKRQWRAGQTLRDAGRAFGTVQADAMQNITGSFDQSANYSAVGTVTNGAIRKTTTLGGAAYSGTSNTSATVDFDASRVARTASEERPANITVTWFIKAYSAPLDAATVAAAQVLADLADVRARATTLEGKTSWELIEDTGDLAAVASWIKTGLSAFRYLKITLNLRPGAAGYPLLQFTTDNGATWVTTGYYNQYIGMSGASNSSTASSTPPGMSPMFLTHSINYDGAYEGIIYDFNRARANSKVYLGKGLAVANGGSWTLATVACQNDGLALAANGLRLIMNTGLFTGRIILEGKRG